VDRARRDAKQDVCDQLTVETVLMSYVNHVQNTTSVRFVFLQLFKMYSHVPVQKGKCTQMKLRLALIVQPIAMNANI